MIFLNIWFKNSVNGLCILNLVYFKVAVMAVRQWKQGMLEVAENIATAIEEQSNYNPE